MRILTCRVEESFVVETPLRRIRVGVTEVPASHKATLAIDAGGEVLHYTRNPFSKPILVRLPEGLLRIVVGDIEKRRRASLAVTIQDGWRILADKTETTPAGPAT